MLYGEILTVRVITRSRPYIPYTLLACGLRVQFCNSMICMTYTHACRYELDTVGRSPRRDWLDDTSQSRWPERERQRIMAPATVGNLGRPVSNVQRNQPGL